MIDLQQVKCWTDVSLFRMNIDKHRNVKIIV